ncbi:hypothetical protein ABIC99_003758 [Sphaerotilus sulfidivorans]|uniref:Uncharacterized protein n=1 Tax=Sphaerotilus sulfidivorans TaxID=639200 RepID=A0ABV2ISI0_9BURK|nr:hypothetical protein [Sphaerotilus sulfidivorans]NZD47536.1 hypothetical protein [Sphaerotilus sulfidivorans]
MLQASWWPLTNTQPTVHQYAGSWQEHWRGAEVQAWVTAIMHEPHGLLCKTRLWPVLMEASPVMSVPMQMVHIRHMGVLMSDRGMPVCVAVYPCRHGFMQVLVVSVIVSVGMLMFQHVVFVLMVMGLSSVPRQNLKRLRGIPHKFDPTPATGFEMKFLPPSSFMDNASTEQQRKNQLRRRNRKTAAFLIIFGIASLLGYLSRFKIMN